MAESTRETPRQSRSCEVRYQFMPVNNVDIKFAMSSGMKRAFRVCKNKSRLESPEVGTVLLKNVELFMRDLYSLDAMKIALSLKYLPRSLEFPNLGAPVESMLRTGSPANAIRDYVPDWTTRLKLT